MTTLDADLPQFMPLFRARLVTGAGTCGTSLKHPSVLNLGAESERFVQAFSKFRLVLRLDHEMEEVRR